MTICIMMRKRLRIIMTGRTRMTMMQCMGMRRQAMGKMSTDMRQERPVKGILMR